MAVDRRARRAGRGEREHVAAADHAPALRHEHELVGRQGWSLHPDRIAKARQLGAQLWRFPGDSDSDRYIWDGNYGPYAIASDGRDNTVTTQPEFLRTDDFVTLLRELGAQPMVTANYGLARIGSVAEAAVLAARWVRHFKVERDFPVRYWELGNEMYGAWETGHTVAGKPDLTGDVYGADFRPSPAR